MGRWGCGVVDQVRVLRVGVRVARGARVGMVDILAKGCLDGHWSVCWEFRSGRGGSF
jgi:hypothetical protein